MAHFSQEHLQEAVQFPAIDEWWKTLQDTAIAFTGKPIEDLDRAELQALTPLLSDAERSKMCRYLIRKRLESERSPLQLRIKPPNFDRRTDLGARCELSMRQVIRLSLCTGRLNRKLELMHTSAAYEPYIDLLQGLDRAVKKAHKKEQSGIGLMTIEESQEYTFIDCLRVNVCLAVPTASNLKMLEGFEKRIKSREKKIAKGLAK